MNRGYDWDGPLTRYFDRIVKRACVSGPRIGHECCSCGRIFKRKHVRYAEGHGWVCRDRCERNHKGLP